MGEFFAANRIRRPTFVMELNGNKKGPPALQRALS
jgi:hypothetical protein